MTAAQALSQIVGEQSEPAQNNNRSSSGTPSRAILAPLHVEGMETVVFDGPMIADYQENLARFQAIPKEVRGEISLLCFDAPILVRFVVTACQDAPGRRGRFLNHQPDLAEVFPAQPAVKVLGSIELSSHQRALVALPWSDKLGRIFFLHPEQHPPGFLKQLWLVFLESDDQTIAEVLVHEGEETTRKESGVEVKNFEQTMATIRFVKPGGEIRKVGNLSFSSPNCFLTEAGLSPPRPMKGQLAKAEHTRRRGRCPRSDASRSLQRHGSACP